MPGESDQQARETAEAVARRSYGKLVAFLAARTRDVTAAEDALSDAFAAALVDWPVRGIPTSPEAWLMTVARRKLIDAVRRRRSGEGAADHLRLMAEELEAMVASKPQIPDERLSLMFACTHPAIERGIRAPLMLQTILGFDAATIASAFLVSPATMGQRLTRAKNKIRQAGIPFRMPERADLCERLDSVLEAIYAAFAEGWSDPAGTETRRRNLAEEGMWLGRLVTSLLPDEPEALGLLALMLHAEARRAARRNAQGEYVPLAEQDPAAWDTQLIEEAETLLVRASTMGSVGRYQLEAAIQSAHVVRRRTGAADWAAIEQLYDALSAMTGSPGRGNQPGHRCCRDPRSRRRARDARCAGGRCPPRRIPTVLGRARWVAGALGRSRRRGTGLSTRDWLGTRSGRPPLSRAALLGAARLRFGLTKFA
jgi:RNA polymerase sigma-70 factor, ECF subfamily